ncbi:MULTISPECIES: head completion/stabilization protein [unclassified Serratia (in: enterobacteria)]|uniref:head completion/stabilization protein n=1 Tax=unclassified Serratia (in: enterobacteria) TaxID=2647522 RepID=UPI003075F57F
MSFLATEPARQASETPSDEDTVITNTAFWPDISLGDLRKVMRLDGQVTTERLRHAAIEAMTNVNNELKAWRVKQQAAGFETLNTVPANDEEMIDNESVLLQRYRRAVYCHAKANLVERRRDVDTTGDGENLAEKLSTTITDLWRDARWAIQDIQGNQRGIAELV